MTRLQNTVCEWRSGVGGEPIWDCEECRKPIPKGERVHFVSDGGYEPRDGTYVGPCCIGKWFENSRPRSGQARDCGPARCAGYQLGQASGMGTLSPLVSGGKSS